MRDTPKIIIVDDDSQVRGTLNRLLSKEGYETRLCATGTEAIKMLGQEKVNLVLLDLILPDMDGSEVIQYMHRSGIDVPIILITGHASTDSAIQALRSGVYDYIRKPIEREEIVRTTKNAIEFNKMKEDVAQANQSLREKEQYYRSVLTGLHEDIVVINQAYQITDVNHEFLRNTGYRRDEVIGRPCYEVFHRRATPCAQGDENCFLDSVFKTGIPGRRSCQVPDGRGSWVWHDILVSPLFDEEGRVTNVIEAIRNITDLVTVKSELDRAERSWQALVESSPDAILMLDTNNAIVSYNQAFLHMFGFQRGEPDGQPAGVLHISEEGFHKLSSEAQGTLMVEWKMRRKDETVFPVEASVSAIRHPDGSIRGYVAIMRDITDRKMAEQRRARLQAALQQTQRLESLGRLAAGIAHDFNNILTNLVGYAELSVASLPKQNPAARYLEKVLDAANRAGELVGQIRAFSRQRGLERQPLHLIPVIEKTMKLLRSSLPPRAEARMALSPGVSPVLASEDQIRQILITLCVNSVLAMKQRGGGLLVVRLDEIDMHSQETLVPQDLRGEKYLRITVEDNGEAVDSRVLQGLFDPMAPDAETDIHRGIGLSVVHEIVSSLGGSVTASSMPGKGNAFLIYLPALESGA